MPRHTRKNQGTIQIQCNTWNTFLSLHLKISMADLEYSYQLIATVSLTYTSLSTCIQWSRQVQPCMLTCKEYVYLTTHHTNTPLAFSQWHYVTEFTNRAAGSHSQFYPSIPWYHPLAVTVNQNTSWLFPAWVDRNCSCKSHNTACMGKHSHAIHYSVEEERWLVSHLVLELGAW